MIVPDSSDAILERLKNNALTAADREVLAKVVGEIDLQNVTQTGKYNVHLNQVSSIQIGDRYGSSFEEIRAIVQEMQALQPHNSSTKSQQSGLLPNNEPLEIPPVESQMLELINFRLAIIAELQKSGEFSSTQQIEFDKLRGKVYFVKEMNQELDAIASSADQILQEAVSTLAKKLQELDCSQESSFNKARSQICLEQQIKLLKQFQEELQDGKVMAFWLKSKNFSQHLGKFALDTYPEIKETMSPRRLEAFYLSVEQFLERLEQCLTWGRTNSLDQPFTPVLLEDKVYKTAFEKLKTAIPDNLPDAGIEQLKEYIDYLIENLPNYRHLDID